MTRNVKLDSSVILDLLHQVSVSQAVPLMQTVDQVQYVLQISVNKAVSLIQTVSVVMYVIPAHPHVPFLVQIVLNV